MQALRRAARRVGDGTAVRGGVNGGSGSGQGRGYPCPPAHPLAGAGCVERWLWPARGRCRSRSCSATGSSRGCWGCWSSRRRRSAARRARAIQRWFGLAGAGISDRSSRRGRGPAAGGIQRWFGPAGGGGRRWLCRQRYTAGAPDGIRDEQRGQHRERQEQFSCHDVGRPPVDCSATQGTLANGRACVRQRHHPDPVWPNTIPRPGYSPARRVAAGGLAGIAR